MFLIGVLTLLGAGSGLTRTLSKVAVSEGYRHFGLVAGSLRSPVAYLVA